MCVFHSHTQPVKRLKSASVSYVLKDDKIGLNGIKRSSAVRAAVGHAGQERAIPPRLGNYF